MLLRQNFVNLQFSIFFVSLSLSLSLFLTHSLYFLKLVLKEWKEFTLPCGNSINMARIKINLMMFNSLRFFRSCFFLIQPPFLLLIEISPPLFHGLRCGLLLHRRKNKYESKILLKVVLDTFEISYFFDVLSSFFSSSSCIDCETSGGRKTENTKYILWQDINISRKLFGFVNVMRTLIGWSYFPISSFSMFHFGVRPLQKQFIVVEE